LADCVSHNSATLEIRFTQAARRHRIGRASVRHVMATVAPVGTITAQGSPAWVYTGRDERGRELEVIAVEIRQAEGRDPFLLVIHVMPTSLRKGNRDA
jgi:hypothetical protein